jgi:Virulence factor
VTRFRVLAWDGIPAQVKAYEEGRRPVSAELPGWFVEHIDREAMRKGLYGSDEYLERWAWSGYHEREGTAEEVAAAAVSELEAEWEPVRRRWESGEDPG